MDKLKRILAIIGIILLVGLYATTLIIAIIGGPNLMTYLTVSIAATILIPVLIFLAMEVGKQIKKRHDENNTF